MSQASGIIPPRARSFGPRASAAPKRPLGIERLELRCPLDASAAFSEVEVQPLLGGGAPPIPAPAIPAITSTLHEPRSEGAEPRALPPQPNQTPSQTPAPNKALTAVRRAAVAKRPLAADPLQTSAQVDSSAPHAPGNAADGVGNETPALETPASPDSGSSDETPGQQTQDRSPELTAGNTEAPGASVDLGSSDLSGSLQAPFPPEAPSRSSAGDTSGTQLLPDPLDPAPTDPADPSGDEPIDPSASTGPLTSTDPLVPPDERAADDPNCPALKPDPARFLTPPGPAGSIALVPPARGRSDYWTSGTAETGWGAEPEAVDGTAIRPSRYGRGESALSRSRYYESLTAAHESPADGLHGRTTALRSFVRQLDPLDGGIAIEGTSETPIDYAALTQDPSRSVPVEPAEPEEATTDHAHSTDLALAALMEEAADAEQLAPEAAQPEILITTVSCTQQESVEAAQSCGEETGEEPVVSLSPAQDFLVNFSRWAALGLLVSHRLSHHVSGRGGWLNWFAELRDFLTGSRSRRC